MDEEVRTEDNRIDAGSALDPANFNTVMLIMLNRIYDVNLAFLATVNPEKAAELYQLHETGSYLAPPPAIAVSDEPAEDIGEEDA